MNALKTKLFLNLKLTYNYSVRFIFKVIAVYENTAILNTRGYSS